MNKDNQDKNIYRIPLYFTDEQYFKLKKYVKEHHTNIVKYLRNLIDKL